MSILEQLALHNQWANALIFDACAAVDPAKLGVKTDGYDSVLGILDHLVQVEYAFLELAEGRRPQRTGAEDLAALRDECTRLDAEYISRVTDLDPSRADADRFLVPWFGFEISLAEGIVQPLTHSHKHRADVSMLLPRLGGDGVEMDFIQWLAEERSGDA